MSTGGGQERSKERKTRVEIPSAPSITQSLVSTKPLLRSGSILVNSAQSICFNERDGDLCDN
jgi:hypothetical protein